MMSFFFHRLGNLLQTTFQYNDKIYSCVLYPYFDGSINVILKGIRQTSIEVACCLCNVIAILIDYYLNRNSVNKGMRVIYDYTLSSNKDLTNKG